VSGSLVRASLLDRAVAIVAPGAAVQRLKARALFTYLSGSYTGGRTDRRATRDWNPAAQSADADTIGDLPALRARSSDLIRNTPLAAGAVRTVCTKVVGTGIMPRPKVDGAVLGMTLEQATDWNRRMKRIFRTVAETKGLDVARRRTFFEMQHQVLFSVLERGDLLVLRRANRRRDALLSTCYQLVEADRLCNPQQLPDKRGLVAGIETDDDGAVLRYHVANVHPGEYTTGVAPSWTAVPAIGADTGLPLAWDLGWKTRPDQTRAVPYLATVIETLKQIDRYGDAELMAAVISAMFTVFVKSEHDVMNGISPGTDASTGKALPPEYKLGPGAIGRLMPGEDVVFADPKRPNAQFQPFVQAWAEQAGVALEIPYEILLKHFTSSYSAARGAQLEAWEPLWVRREWLSTSFCQPIYEAVVAESVARGWIEAPGFFDDPWVRLAYTRARWVGPSPGQIDPRVEVEAAATRVREGFSTLEEETPALTGGDWEENHAQQVIEQRARKADGLLVEPVAFAAPGNSPLPPGQVPQDQADEEDAQGMQALVRESSRVLAQVRETQQQVQHAATSSTAAIERALEYAVNAPAPQFHVAPPAVHLAVTVPPATAGTRRMTITRDASGRTVGAVVSEEGEG